MNTYTLTSTDATDGANLVLTNTFDSSSDSITIAGGENITVTQSSNLINIFGTDITAPETSIAFAIAFG